MKDGGRIVGVRIGQHAPEIDALLRRHGASTGAFITAWNPGSGLRPRAINEAAGRALEGHLDAMGITWLPHAGIGAGDDWEPELGVFALDIPAAQALALATANGQNAIVTVVQGEPARLVVTRLMPEFHPRQD